MNHAISKPFKGFLVVYGGFLIYHLAHVGVHTASLWVALLAGMAFAMLAHKRHGYTPSLLLIAHMSVEWYSHAIHSNHYTHGEYLFHGVHACLDLVFLCAEAKAHYKRYSYALVGGVVVFLGVLFWYFYVPASAPSFAVSPLVAQALELQKQMSGHHDHAHGGGTIHYLVIGGMLGCVMSHLFLASRWKHVHAH